MSEHTKGPWCVRGNIIKQDFAFMGTGEGPIIASVTGGKTSGPFFIESEEEVAANALLVSTAPDLLEALYEIRALAHDDIADPDDHAVRSRIVAMARDAIKKATGA